MLAKFENLKLAVKQCYQIQEQAKSSTGSAKVKNLHSQKSSFNEIVQKELTSFLELNFSLELGYQFIGKQCANHGEKHFFNCIQSCFSSFS